MVHNSAKSMETVLNGNSNNTSTVLPVDLKILNNNSNRKYVLNELVNQLEINVMNENKREILKVNRIVENAIHWALTNGFVLVPRERSETDLMIVTYMPFTLYPSPFKRAHFEKVYKLQPHINELMYKIASSTQILERAFKDLLSVDSFLSSLWRIYKQSAQQGYNQQIHLSIFRVDYMLHQALSSDETKIKQVEINTISAGFGYVSTRMSSLHKEILNWSNYSNEMLAKLPENVPVENIATGFVEAWRLYGNRNAIVLFLVLEIEINIADQRQLEYEIVKQEPGIRVVRCTLDQIDELGHLNEDKVLMYNDQEVAIVYFRTGYDPAHYTSQVEWNALLKVEMSRAVKCPSVAMFLAGMKKLQEFLAVDKNLREVCDNNQQLVDSFKDVFAKFLTLEENDNFEEVLANPADYVLKPQREGGGNNFYNEEIKAILSKIKETKNGDSGENYDRNLYIAMELLRTLVSDNYIISSQSQRALTQSLEERGEKILPAIKNDRFLLKKQLITNELGIYGVLVRNGEKVVVNKAAGYCLRSKPASDNEAGVMHGSGDRKSVV